MSGEGSRGLCWTCESPDHHQQNVGSLGKTGTTPREFVLTIANNSVVENNANITLDTGTNETTTSGGENVVDNVDNPCTFLLIVTRVTHKH